VVFPPYIVALPALAIVVVVLVEVRRYRRYQRRAARMRGSSDVAFAPTAARAHGSRRAVPPAVDRSRRP
jgi:hypothetical protein